MDLSRGAGPTSECLTKCHPVMGSFGELVCEVVMSSRVKRWSIAGAILVIGVFSLGYAYWRYEFPYGCSHCCDQILHGALEDYAAENEGNFPAGQPTPEASLSLLFPKYADAYLLGGKAVPEATAQAILDTPSLLGPETCSWHYVEGLSIYDDPRLALFWDKTGLGHNGQRIAVGGHTVLFIGGDRRHVSAKEWPQFLKEQEELWAQLRGGEGICIRGSLPDQQSEAQLRVMDGCLYGIAWHNWHRTSSELIAHVDKEPGRGVVGLPVVSTAELRAAKVATDPLSIWFILKDRAIVFNGAGFRFE